MAAIQWQPLLLLVVSGSFTIWLSTGQQSSAPRIRPPYKMVITNELHVPDAWVVHELEMFFGHCYQQQRIPSWGQNAFSSGNRRDNPESTMSQAFDGNLQTNWTADCKISMGGCRARATYIGLDITGTGPWEAAMAPNASEALREACQAKCIRVFQSDDPMHKSDSIALQEVFIGGTSGPYTFKTIMIFDNVAGGAWSRRPAEKDTLWRITTLDRTRVRWGVAELRFFKDIFCTDEVKGAALSSGAYDKLNNWEGRAFDDDVTTSWVADCVTREWKDDVQVGKKHCAPREAWIGIDFGDDVVTVRCMKFYQQSHDITTPVPEEPKFSAGLALDSYDGKKWVEVERFWNPQYCFHCSKISSSLQPTLITPFVGTTGLKPGNWEDTRPADRAAWRLLNDDWIPNTWLVHEIEFYVRADCSGNALVGEAVSMAGVEGLEDAELAFDGNSATANQWRSTCGGVDGSCNPHEAWIGLYFKHSQPNVTCFRILQIHDINNQATSVALGVWNHGEWRMNGVHRDIGGGTWNRRPSPKWSMWRVLNNEYVPRQWRVMEIRAYSDPLCLREPGPANAIGAGYLNWRDNLDNAFDASGMTGWGADCDGCEDRKYWIGGELQNSTRFDETLHDLETRNESGAKIVACIKIWQSPNRLEQTRSLRVDVWEGKDWMVSTLSMTGVVISDGGGVWMRSPSVFATRWRIVGERHMHTDGPWRLHQVEFYRDIDCTIRLRIPEDGGTAAVMSGYESEVSGYGLAELTGSDLFSEGYFPFDGKSDTSVKLPHAPSKGAPAWYGIDFLSEITWVRCVRIKQGSLAPEQVEAVKLEYWDGKNWSQSDEEMSDREKLLTHLGGGGWQRRPAADRSMWRLENREYVPEGWALYEAELHITPSCSNPVLPSQTTTTAPVEEDRGLTEGYYDLFETPRMPAFYALKPTWTRLVPVVNYSATFNNWPGIPKKDNYAMRWRGYIEIAKSGTYTFTVESDDGSILLIDSGKVVDNDGLHTMRRVSGATSLSAGKHSVDLKYFEQGDAAGCIFKYSGPDTNNTEVVVPSKVLLPHEVREKVTGDNSTKLSGVPIASGFIPQERKHGPQHAFDLDLQTPWISQCAQVQENLLPKGLKMPTVGCQPGDAWIGLDLHLQREDVRCVRVYQLGYRRMQSQSVGVSKWNGVQWEHIWTLDGLGGSAWDQRPRGPSTMWRLFHKVTRPEKCPREMARIFRRNWGISEFQLFSDDDCDKELKGGIPISSGTIEAFRETPYDPADFPLSRGTDGDQSTEWAANCLLGYDWANKSRVRCEGEWIGLDFGDKSVEARCLKVMQSRRESSTCCDPAETMELHRWNGDRWVEASWRHEPSKGSTEPARNLGAVFAKMGKCQEDSYVGDIDDLRIMETRARRDSDSCLVPLTGATVLLGEAACIEHRRCEDAFGAGGQCCPMEGTLSRCCCNYLTTESIFVDEVVSEQVKDYLQFEHAMILISDYLPWLGGAVFCVMFFLAVCMPANAKERMEDWVEPDGRCRCCRRFWQIVLYPAIAWRTLLREEGNLINATCRWFCLPNGRIPRGMEWFRGVLFIGLGIFIGGISPWMTLGAVFGQTALMALNFLGLSIRWSKSMFDPGDDQDMVLREKVTEQPLKDEFHTAQAVDVARDFISCVVLGVIYFLKFIFDLLVCRAQLISYEAIPSIEADRVVDIFPGLVSLLREPGMIIYDLMYWASQVMTYVIGYFVGIPKCEGSCVLIGSVALVMVLVTLTKWLNYDFFGLYTAARQVAKSTRPECQKAFFQGLVMMCLSITFGAIQCAMVLFSRAIKVANPFRDTEWACEWNDIMALLVGRGLILVATLVGTSFFFLCANGHFMGQDYIIKPVGRFLHLDLDALDPDGTGPEGGMFQCQVMFAAIPTLAGVWLDWWNVKAFLVRERGTIYAEQLRDPQPCLTCGRIHTKYVNIMCATGRTCSLACQILPFGILIGKAGEYMNDPPMIYWGDELECITVRPTPSEPRPDLGKGKYGLKALLLIADASTLVQEYVLPLIRRLSVLCQYIFIMIGIFAITEDNLVTLGRVVILAGFYLAFIKAAGEGLFESFCSWIISLIYMTIARIEGKLEGVDLSRAVGGQTLSGGVVAAVVAVCLIRREWMPKPASIAVAAVIGYAVSLLALVLNLMLETLPPKPDEPPRRNPFPTIAKVFFGMAVAALVTIFTAPVLKVRSIMAIAVIEMSIQIIVLKLIFVEQKTILSENTDEGLHVPKEGEVDEEEVAPSLETTSSTLTVLTTRRWLPGAIGVGSAALAGATFSQAVAYFSNSSQGAFSSLLAAIPSGLVAGLAIHSVIDKNPIICGFFVGLGAFVGISFWNGLAALFFGAIAGVCAGSFLEIFEIRKKFVDHLVWKKEDDARKAIEEDPDYLEELEHRKRMSTMARTEKFDEAIENAQLKAAKLEAKRQAEKLKQLDQWQEETMMLADNSRRSSAVAQGMLHDTVAHGIPVGTQSAAHGESVAAITEGSPTVDENLGSDTALSGMPEDGPLYGTDAASPQLADSADLRDAAQHTDSAPPPAIDAGTAEVARPADAAEAAEVVDAPAGNLVRSEAADDRPTEAITEPSAAVSAADGAAVDNRAPTLLPEGAQTAARAAAPGTDIVLAQPPPAVPVVKSQQKRPGPPEVRPMPERAVIADGFSLERDQEEEEEPEPVLALAHPALSSTASQAKAGRTTRRAPQLAAGQGSSRAAGQGSSRANSRGNSGRGASQVGSQAGNGADDAELFGRWENRSAADQPTRRTIPRRPPAQSLWGKAAPPDRHRIQPPSNPVRKNG